VDALWCLIAAIVISAAPATGRAEQLSFYGTPGLIDMPSAQVMPDGNFAVTSGYFGGNLRNTLSFQITPRLSGAFRYAVIDGFQSDGATLYDRSFDLHLALLPEGAVMPSVAMGLRDFGGTGIYSSEYLVASKSIGPDLTITAGLGWGRLGARDGFANPLGRLSDHFDTRPDVGEGGIGTTGQLDFGAWFRGDAALFGGVTWQFAERATLVAEYSSDTYVREAERGVVRQTSPLNLGLRYGFENGVDVGIYSLYGTGVGASLSYVSDPARPAIPGGREAAAPSIMPRDLVAGAGWNRQDDDAELRDVLRLRLGAEGIDLRGLTVEAGTARVQMENQRWPVPAQALGRTARIVANTLPPGVRRFELTFVTRGMPVTMVSLARDDLEALEHDVDGAALMLARAQITDAADVPPIGQGAALSLDLSPYLDLSYFDPDRPVRADLGLQLSVRYSPAPGLMFSGLLRQPVIGNIGDATRVSDSVLPHVRSDAALYATGSDPEISQLTAATFFRPGRDLFGRVTVGYLEPMFGGLSAEVLWRPVDGLLALGLEINHVWQRNYDQGFGFQDYEVLTGHASAYYAFGNGFEGQINAGRYLAGDYGATVRLDRVFGNGFRIGAFATLTDASFEEFGEGSFDKGIVIEVPLTWLSGQPSRDVVRQVLRPVLRDGGARIQVADRLYDLTDGYRADDLADEWGKFWR